jgi:hypothetical protein
MASRKIAPGIPTMPAAPESAAAVPEWGLPSGEDLISFALSTGFTVSHLLDGEPVPEDSASAGKAAVGRPARAQSGRGGDPA